MRIFVLAERFGNFAESTISNSASFDIYSTVQHPSFSVIWQCQRFSYNAWCYHTTYFLLPLFAMYMAFSFHPYNHAGICVSHLIACVLLVPTLLCMIRHTKGLLRYLYSSNYPTVDCIFHLYFSWNTVGDCKYSSGIAHCRFNAQEQVQGVQGDPNTP